ncbi:MotA/TolQ/ExbB proton channel family protein [Paraferrimonas haliotis]|uniref:MotA/TolQ/ExbB proton channel family protein n=1 Tax=Paraferrimonas haliotis TaxID=2013866 RepID=UPI000BA973B4|nr:MotA/TolQ/ExbB proton channel family protein [Paraferrimonas haliotis]
MDIINLQADEAMRISVLLTIVVCSVIVFLFFTAVRCSKRGKKVQFVSYAPALLTTLGIFGTFAGIVVGLMAFDTTNIDGSIEGLLNGLKTAFLTSLVGILLSLIFRTLQTTGAISKNEDHEAATNATPEDILAAINKQKESIDTLVVAIGGDNDGSILSQMKLLRGDINDNQKLTIKSTQETAETLKAINEQLTHQKDAFAQFSDKLWIKMQDFADMLSKSATETVIEALKQVITDFNKNLTEQFGDNFKQLNEAVKELVTWQDNYKAQIADMTEQYKLGVASISASEESIAKISTESKVIPETMTNLKDVMEINQHQLKELERHLEAFKDIRDRAVDAVPEIRKQIDETVRTIAESVESANVHYKELLTQSDKYIQAHITTSNDLLEKFVSNTKDGVQTIGDKLSESATKVEKVISEGANEFTDKVHQTNAGLQTTADHVTSQTEVIKNHLKDTVEDLNDHVRQMIHTLVDDSKALASTLTDANKALVSDTSLVRDNVTQSIDAMQKKLESSLEDVFTAQTQHMTKVFSNVDASLKDQVGKTGEAVEKQLSMIDQSMQQELNRVMNEMGKALGQISNQFVKDYSKLVNQMNSVVTQTV